MANLGSFDEPQDNDIKPVILSMNHYVIGRVPDFILAEINAEVQGMLDRKFKNTRRYKDALAGEIQHEYAIVNSASSIEMFMNHAASKFWESCNRSDLAARQHVLRVSNYTSILNYKEVWANFQKKYEYNPLHNHAGKLSFVIWLRIPYDIETEFARASHGGTNYGSGPGTFSFTFHDSNYGYFDTNQRTDGIISHPIKLDKSCEGKFALFPSYLRHSVEPFYTSDGYRISIAGNLEFA